MTLHLTRDEADRLTADERVVLFRAGEDAEYIDQMGNEIAVTIPPDEFFEAAKPCETCDGRGFNMIQLSPTSQEVSWCTNPDCLGGKRRIAAVVPCDHPDHENVKGGLWLCAIDGPPHDNSGLVTVDTVVVEWGPLEVVEWGDRHDNCIVLMDGALWVWRDHSFPDGVLREIKNLPPGVDPQSLVGQYALGIRKVDQ